MSEFKLTIDGREVAGRSGQTILEVCKDHGIHVPTLCHHPALTNVGACRLCIVEVEGDRRLNSSCTTPAREGMVVRTDTERLKKQRLLTLELLFSERNHICPFCAQSGHCELQDLAYEHGMTHPRYPYLFPKLAPDTSSPYFVMEPGRCILCGRCVRACEELAGVHTLDFGGRGSKETIVADRGIPIGESTCIACGSCVEVCPTGAIFEKRSAYWMRERSLPTVTTTCPACGVGCRFDAALKPGSVVRLQSTPEAPVNGPLLCSRGRFRLLEESRARLLRPLIRREGELLAADWPEAMELASERLRAAGKAKRAAGLVTARMPNEVLYQFGKLLRQVVGTDRVATLDGRDMATRREAAQRLLGNGKAAQVECTLDEVDGADAFLVVGADLSRTHPVVAAWITRAVYGRQTPLVVLNTRQTDLGDLADVWLKPRRRQEGVVLNGLLHLMETGSGPGKEARDALAPYTPARVAAETQIREADLTRAAGIYARARSPLILYGQDLTRYGDPDLIVTLMSLSLGGSRTAGGRLRVCGLAREASSSAAAELGVDGDLRPEDLDGADLDCLYMLTGDAEPALEEADLDRLGEARCLIVQASRRSALTDRADIVLPDLTWLERSGTFANTDGRLQKVQQVLPPPDGVKDDLEIMSELAGRLGAALHRDVIGIQGEIAGQVPGFHGAFGDGDVRIARETADLTGVAVQVVQYL